MTHKLKAAKRSQADRSAATRRLLLDAAVGCLFEFGYGQTTTILIAQRAGISRGALLHQFPSKVDLMAYVVETVFEDELPMYRELLANVHERAAGQCP
jgi:AcrR family transcriptional regulator